MTYPDAITGAVPVGERVAVVGAGGIGVDVSRLPDPHRGGPRASGMAHWGVGDPAVDPGGLTEKKPRTPAREVYLLQRKTTADRQGPGEDVRLGAPRGAQGLRRAPAARRRPTTASTTTACTSPSASAAAACWTSTTSWCAPARSPCASLYDELVAAGVDAHLIGGADVAAELDAKRAIKQGTELAAAL